MNREQLGEQSTLDPEAHLPHRMQVDPIVAYKSVHFRLVAARLEIVSYNRAVAVDATAECHKWVNESKGETKHPEPAPHLPCQCGFYAIKTKAPFEGIAYETIIATVELFGKVIVGASGYRASRQRILSIEVKPTCNFCAAIGDGRRRGVGVFFAIEGTPFVLCERHGALAEQINGAMRMTMPELTAAAGTSFGWWQP